jgi:multiple sugar transport system substrate-binding protein
MSTDSQGKHGRRMSRRSFLRGVAFVGGAAALAACGGTAGTPAVGGDQTSAPAQAGNAVTITQWYHQYGEEGTQQAAQRFADEYSKVNPKVKVNMQWIPGEYDTKLNAALLTDEGPDTFESHLNITMVQAGQIASLDDLFTPDVKNDFDPQDLATNTVDGKIYAIRMIRDPQLIYYRKSMLDGAGIKPPATFDELIEATKKLNSGKVKGLFFGNDGGVGVMTGNAVYAAGSSLLDGQKVAFNNDNVAAAYQKARELAQTDALLIGAPTDWWDPSAFNQNLAAITWNGLWAMPGIKKALNEDFGVLPFPAIGANGKPVIYLGGWSAMVNAKSKHIEEAKAFTKWLWLENSKAQEDWSLSYGFHIPPRMSVAKNAAALKSGQAAEVLDLTGKYGYVDNPLWNGAMATALGDALTNVIKNNADPKAELATAATKAQAELEKELKK